MKELYFSDEAALMYMQEGMVHGHLHQMGFDRQPPSRQGILDNPFFMKLCRIQAKKFFDFQGPELLADVGDMRVNSMLDIGCGLGLCSLSYYHAASNKPNLYLVDGGTKLEGDEATYCASFTKGDNLVSDLRVTMDMMLRNGVPQEKLNFLGPDPSNISNLRSIDLVVSNVSWFYHYPPEVYWEAVNSVLHEQSAMRVDIRVGPYADPHPEYVEFLHESFHVVEELRCTGVPGKPSKTLTLLAKRPKG